MADTDLILLRSWVVRGDAEAFDELVRRHAGMVYNTCRRILRDGADTEDVVQECFLKLAEKAGNVRTSVTGWLHAAAVSRSLNLIKYESSRQKREQTFVEHCRDQETTSVTWNDLEGYVDEAIASLPVELRDPVIAHFLGRQTHEAIAHEIGLPRRTVTHRIGRGVDAIREHLRQHGISTAGITLTALLVAHTAEAVPPALATSLGKIALSGIRAIPETTSLGIKALMWKITVATVATLLLVTGGLWLKTGWSNTEQPSGELKSSAMQTAAYAASAPQQTTPVLTPETESHTPSFIDSAAIKSTSKTGSIEDPSRYISLAGIVQDMKGQPIPGAKVLLGVTDEPYEVDKENSPASALEHFFFTQHLSRARQCQTITDSQGRFTLKEIKYGGNAWLSALKDGYAQDRVFFKLDAGDEIAEEKLELRPGFIKRGTLNAEDGSPIADAIVETYIAWKSTGLTEGWGFDITDDQGNFALGFSEDVEKVHIKTTSNSKGQDFFPNLPCNTETFHLQMKAKASLHGQIRGAAGRAIKGGSVSLVGQIPYPDITIVYKDIEPFFLESTKKATVCDDGTYAISGLYPDREYTLKIELQSDKQSSAEAILTPAESKLIFSPGENREFNCELGDAVTIRGHVLTERMRRPLAQMNVTLIAPSSTTTARQTKTDNTGAFSFTFNGIPGTYRVVPQPSPSSEDLCARLRNRPDNQVLVASGETREVDVYVPDPVSFPIRVLDPKGKSPWFIKYSINFIEPEGLKTEYTDSCTLDEQGRTTLTVYGPAQEAWVAISNILSS